LLLIPFEKSKKIPRIFNVTPVNNCKNIFGPLFCHFPQNSAILRPLIFYGHGNFLGFKFFVWPKIWPSGNSAAHGVAPLPKHGEALKLLRNTYRHKEAAAVSWPH
jgi:hypothetical protein